MNNNAHPFQRIVISWLLTASAAVAVAAAVALVGIERAGWQLGFSSTDAAAVFLISAGLHGVFRLDGEERADASN